MDEQADKTSKDFKMRNKRLLLTYKNHYDKSMMCEFLKELVAQEVTGLIICHEDGDPEMPYFHTHIAIEVKSTIYTRNPRFFDYDGVHPHIKVLPSAKAFKDAIKYCSKEDPEPYKENCDRDIDSEIDRVLQAPTLIDAIRIGGIQKANQITTIYSLREKKYEYQIPETLHAWQAEFLEELENCPRGPSRGPDRKIRWYFDPAGANGKSTMMKIIMETYKKDATFVKQFGGQKDFSTVITGAIQNGWTGKIFIADLARSAESKEIYAPLEDIKDGTITSIKYNGTSACWGYTPWVIIFANFLPNVKKMTWDRWDIQRIIREDEERKAIPLTLREVELMYDTEHEDHLSSFATLTQRL